MWICFAGIVSCRAVCRVPHGWLQLYGRSLGRRGMDDERYVGSLLLGYGVVVLMIVFL